MFSARLTVLMCTADREQEYCAGGDIATLIKTNHGMSEDQARVFMSQLGAWNLFHYGMFVSGA